MYEVDKLTVRQLRLLREIDRVGTWTDAGANLGMAQSTVSAAMSRLEALAGTKLFESVGVRRVPTRAGRRLMEAADRVLPVLDDVWAGLAPDTIGGVLSVGVIDAVPLYLGRGRVAAVVEALPGVEVRLVVDASERLLERLADREIDVAVVTGPEDRFPAVEIASERLRVYGEGDRCVLYPEGSRTRALIDAGLRRLGRPVDPVATATNPDVLRELARLGTGWTVLPEGVAEAGPEPLRPIGPVVATRRLLAVRRSVGTDPVADRFVDALGDLGLG